MNTQTQEALKMAIEMLEKLSYEYGRLLDGDQDYGLLPSEINADIIKTYYVKRTCQEALEQPAQEPVAWMDEEGIWQYEWESHSDNKKPLYTHPAPSWQGLSDDEIDKIYYKTFDTWSSEVDVEFARAIEQALKEKNT